MYTQEYDKITIYEVDKEEIDVQVQINFIAPKNVLNNNIFYIGEANDALQQMQLNAVGEFDSVQVVKILIEKLKEYDENVTFSQQDLIYQNKLTLLFTKETVFKTEDYYFQKVLGYTEVMKGTTLQFPKRMFTGIARMLNVMCYFLSEPNYVQKGKKLFILLKTSYNFLPGQNRIIQGESQPTFSTSQLSQGFAVQFCDENYVPLELEDEDYYIDLYIQKSKRRVDMQMQIQQEKQEQMARQQQIEQYEQEKQKQRQQQMEQQIQIFQQQQNAQFEQDEKDFQSFMKIKDQVLYLGNKMQNVINLYKNNTSTKKIQLKLNTQLQQIVNKEQRDYSVELQLFEKKKKEYYEWDQKQRDIILNHKIDKDSSSTEQELYQFMQNYLKTKIQKQQELQKEMPQLLEKTHNLLVGVRERVLTFGNVIKELTTEYKFPQKINIPANQTIAEINKVMEQLYQEGALNTLIFQDEQRQFDENEKILQNAQFDIFIDEDREQQALNQLTNKLKLVQIDNQKEEEEVKNRFKQDFQNIQQYLDKGFSVKQVADYMMNKILFEKQIINRETFLQSADVENGSGQKIIEVIDPYLQQKIAGMLGVEDLELDYKPTEDIPQEYGSLDNVD